MKRTRSSTFSVGDPLPPCAANSGLQTEKASSILLECIDRHIKSQREKKKNEKYNACSRFMFDIIFDKHFLIALVAAATLLSYYLFVTIYVNLHSSALFQYRAIGALFGAVLIPSISFVDCFLDVRERQLKNDEFLMKLELLYNKLGQVPALDIDLPYRLPHCSSISTVSAVRDNRVVPVPVNFLVANDIIILSANEYPPCKVRHFPVKAFHNCTLEKCQLFDEHTAITGSYLSTVSDLPYAFFQTLEIPYEKVLNTLLNQLSDMRNNRQFNFTDFSYQILISTMRLACYIFYLLSLIIGLFRLFFIGNLNVQWADLLLLAPIDISLPLLMLTVPSFYHLWRIYGASRILVLYDSLIKNSIVYDRNKPNEDEYDADALSYVEKVKISYVAVLRQMLLILRGKDVTRLPRLSSFFEPLGKMTALAFLDREGTMTNLSPVVQEVALPNVAQSDDGDLVVLDININSSNKTSTMIFQDKNWQEYLSQLKPLGLSCQLLTRCQQMASTSVSSNFMTLAHGKYLPSMYSQSDRLHSTCQCSFASLIGFQPSVQDLYERLGFLMVLPNTSTDISQTSSVILSGSTVNSSRSLLCSSGYTKFSTQIPFLLCGLFKEDHGFQLLCEGTPDMILPRCTESWNGSLILPFSDLDRDSVIDFCQSAVSRDLIPLVFSYAPISPSQTLLGSFAEMKSDMLLMYENISLTRQTIDTKTLSPSTLTTSISSPKLQHENSLHNMTQLPPAITKAASVSRQISELAYEKNSVLQDDTTDLLKDHIFLGVTCLGLEPRFDLREFIEDLGVAGIRFVYFSNAGLRQTKAFGERLGLDVAWNACILLESKHPVCNVDDIDQNSPTNIVNDAVIDIDIDPSSVKARLPVGVEHIRQHILSVDDVPLHVPLFARCQQSSIKETMEIFKENGDVVCCIGSSLNARNSSLYFSADLGISAQPFTFKSTMADEHLEVSSTMAASWLTGISAAISIPIDASPYILLELVRESRSVNGNIEQSIYFLCNSYFLISFVMLFAYALTFPPILNTYQVIWLVAVVLPLQTCSILFTPHDSDLLNQFPSRRSSQILNSSMFFFNFILLFLLTICILLLIFAIALHNMGLPVFAIRGSWLSWTLTTQWRLLYCQNFVTFALALCFVAFSASSLCSRLYFWEFSPTRNLFWLGCSLFVVAIQFAFTIGYVASKPQNVPLAWSQFQWVVYFLSIVSIMTLLVNHHLMKLKARHENLKSQKRAKLEFHTRLGMHSPV